MSDLIDYYIDNEGHETGCRAFSFISKPKGKDCEMLHLLLKEVIKCCVNKEKDLNPEIFKKLRIIVINEYGFSTVEKMVSKVNSKYEYIIFIPATYSTENSESIKHKMAHEIAHFLFSIQGRSFAAEENEEKECNAKAEEWGFPSLA